MSNEELDRVEAAMRMLELGARRTTELTTIFDFLAGDGHPIATFTREARMASAELERIKGRLASMWREVKSGELPAGFVQLGDALPDDLKEIIRTIEAKPR